MVTPALRVASRRDRRRHLGQTLLSLLGIALGVAVLVAVDLANESARRAFDLSLTTLTGKATHRLSAGTHGLPEGLYTTLRVRDRLRPSTPVIEGLATYRGEPFRLLGIDPLSDGDFRPASARLPEGDLRALLTQPATVLMSARDLDRLGLQPGADIAVDIAGRTRTVRLVGRLQGDNPAALEGLMVADIATAQELLQRVGYLDRIDLILTPAQAAALPSRLPAGVQLAPVRADSSTQQRMTAAFQTNLTAMGLLALLVGALLVYNTMTFSVLRRRRLLGLLRVLGATRGDLFRLVLRESLLLGVVGSLLGVLLGMAIGQGLVKLVTRTINDLYFVLTVSSLLVSPGVLVKGFAVGLAATLGAALGPAWDAARTSPQDATRRSSVERRVHRAAPWLTLAGVLVAGSGLISLPFQGNGLTTAFVALFMVIIGFALTVPWMLLALTRLAQPLVGRVFGNAGRLAARNVAAGLSRSGVAVAALTVAVAATVGVGTMVESFRATVALWLEQTLASDIYISLPGSAAERRRNSLPPELLAALRELPGVASVSEGRPGEVDAQFGPLPMLALNDAPQVRRGFRFLATVDTDPWPALRRGAAVFVSEALAYRHDLRPGDTLTLTTPQGPRPFTVGGVFSDYSTDRGLVLLDRASYARLWHDPGVSSSGLVLTAGADPARVLAAVRRLVAASGLAVQVRPTAEIRAESLAVFDRTFAITGVLRLLAVGVAFIGVLSALLALQLDRAREHATLRALGLTPRQLGGLVSLECGLMGLAAGLLALPLGWLMAQLLIQVINRRSFGWTMQSLLPPGVLGEAVLLAVAAALLAGLYPAWRLARIAPAMALREE